MIEKRGREDATRGAREIGNATETMEVWKGKKAQGL